MAQAEPQEEKFSPEVESRIQEIVLKQKIRQKKIELETVVSKTESKKAFMPEKNEDRERELSVKIGEASDIIIPEAPSVESMPVHPERLTEHSIADIIDSYVLKSRRNADTLDDATLKKALIVLNKQIGTAFAKISYPELEIFHPDVMQRIANYTPYSFSKEIRYFFEGTDNHL